jgi:TP901 family phage tail tape measure protein
VAAADRAQLIAELVLDDKFTKPLNRIDKRLGAFSGAVNRNLARGLDSALTTVARGVVNIGKSITTAAIDWEDAFQGVVKTVDTTPEKMDEIALAIRNMATEMPVAAAELAAIAEMGGAMGIEAEGIEEFTRQVAILASTTNLSTEDAAAGLGQLQNTIGLTAAEFDNFSAALVELGNEGSSVETTILEIARRMGASATAFGISKDAVLGWAAAAANLGMEADAAGGALQRVFTKLQLKISGGSKAVEKIMGRSAKDIRKMFEKDATRGLELFIRKLAKIPPAERLQAIVDVFGKDQNIIRALSGMTNEIEKTGKALDDGTRAWHENAAAQEEFDKRNATVRSAITRLRNGLTDAAISVGEGFTPALGRAADKLSAFLKLPQNRQALKELGADIGKMIDGVDWSGLLGHARDFMGILKSASGYAKALWDGFSALPSDVKSMLVGFAAINKLTGGAPVKIAIDFAKEGLGKIFERGTPANPMYVVGKGIGTGGGDTFVDTPDKDGKPRSNVGKAFDAVAKIAIVGFVAEMATQLYPVINGLGKQLHEQLKLPELDWPLPEQWPWGSKNVPTILPEIFGGNGFLGGTPADKPLAGTGLTAGLGAPGAMKALAALKPATDTVGTKVDASKDSIVASQGKLDTSILAARDATHQAKERVAAVVASGAVSTSWASRAAGMQAAGATGAAAGRIVGAIYGAQDTILVNNNIQVSASGVTSAQTTVSRQSKPSSRSDDSRGGP